MSKRRIGERIGELRKQYGWSQMALAKKLDVSYKAVKNWEAGISAPAADNIAELAKIFAVSADYILDICRSSPIYIDQLSHKEQILIKSMCQLLLKDCGEAVDLP